MGEQYIAIKMPAGVEDLLLGKGTVKQTRSGVEITITKINSDTIPYEDNLAETIKTKLDQKLEVPVGTNINVVVGDPDSAGPGFRELKIPN